MGKPKICLDIENLGGYQIQCFQAENCVDRSNNEILNLESKYQTQIFCETAHIRNLTDRLKTLRRLRDD